MGCLSLKSVPEEDKNAKESNKIIEKHLEKEKRLYKSTHRLLLLGEFVHFHCGTVNIYFKIF